MKRYSRLPSRTNFLLLLMSLTALAMAIMALSPAADSSPAAKFLPGVPSTIETIYVVAHEHMDIGFDVPPEEMREWCKQHIDAQVAFARTRPDYVWNIEDTWDFDNWLDRSTPSEIAEMVNLIDAGRIGLGAGHSTLHTGKAGVEEMNRFLYNARDYREWWGFPLGVVFNDDVPGATWAFPQVLARSGVKYLVCGENMFIGGGFTQPYKSYLFHWEGPDGSRVLTWSTQNAYNEGWAKYGIPYGSGGGTIDITKLQTVMNELTTAGYPYDTLMIQHARDAARGVSTAQYEAINAWNATYENPKFILARPEMFFELMLERYGEVIPVETGNWTTRWDTAMIYEPRGEKIVKNSQSQVPSAEKIWAFASALGLGDYPHDVFDNAWDMILTVDEHSGAGPGWPNYYTQEQVDEENVQHWGYALSAQESTAQALTTGAAALFSAAPVAGFDSLIVFNPLSWERTDLARVELSSRLFTENFMLQDTVTLDPVPYQRDAATQSVIFVAKSVPPIGFKRYRVIHAPPIRPATSLVVDPDFIENVSPAVFKSHRVASTPPPPQATSLVVGPNFIENNRFRVELNAQGTITSIFDRTASRDIVTSITQQGYRFNRALEGENLEFFLGGGVAVPEPASSTIAAGMVGPVAASIRVESPAYPIAASEIILYEGLDRIDIVNTPDRDEFTYAPLDQNSRYYGFTFPFDLAGYTARIDTAAGWLDPGVDCLEGSFTGSFAVQNGLDISEAGYGIAFAAPDVYTHSFSRFQTPFLAYPPLDPTVVSSFVRYSDESDLKGTAIGEVNVEPGAGPQWDLHYSIIPHNRAFDPVMDALSLWEVSAPLVGAELPAAPDGLLPENERSFLTVDVDNVIITDIKKADFGEGIIVRLQEIGGQAGEVALSWPGAGVYTVTETSPVEEDIEVLAYSPTGPPLPGIVVSMGAHEILCLRLDIDAPSRWRQGTERRGRTRRRSGIFRSQ